MSGKIRKRGVKNPPQKKGRPSGTREKKLVKELGGRNSNTDAPVYSR